MDVPPVLRGGPREVENIDLQPMLPARLFGDLEQPPAFRHLARASVFAAGRPVDDQDARRAACILELLLRPIDRRLRRDPVLSEVVGRMRIACSGFPGPGAFRLSLIQLDFRHPSAGFERRHEGRSIVKVDRRLHYKAEPVL